MSLDEARRLIQSERDAERASRAINDHLEREYRKAYAERWPTVRELERELRADRHVVRPR